MLARIRGRIIAFDMLAPTIETNEVSEYNRTKVSDNLLGSTNKVLISLTATLSHAASSTEVIGSMRHNVMGSNVILTRWGSQL